MKICNNSISNTLTDPTTKFLTYYKIRVENSINKMPPIPIKTITSRFFHHSRNIFLQYVDKNHIWNPSTLLKQGDLWNIFSLYVDKKQMWHPSILLKRISGGVEHFFEPKVFVYLLNYPQHHLFIVGVSTPWKEVSKPTLSLLHLCGSVNIFIHQLAIECTGLYLLFHYDTMHQTWVDPLPLIEYKNRII